MGINALLENELKKTFDGQVERNEAKFAVGNECQRKQVEEEQEKGVLVVDKVWLRMSFVWQEMVSLLMPEIMWRDFDYFYLFQFINWQVFNW